MAARMSKTLKITLTCTFLFVKFPLFRIKTRTKFILMYLISCYSVSWLEQNSKKVKPEYLPVFTACDKDIFNKEYVLYLCSPD